jgi:hypothetical protein
MAPQPELSTIPAVFVMQTTKGTWLVTEAAHRFGGTFESPTAAMKFARQEAELRHCVVIQLPS